MIRWPLATLVFLACASGANAAPAPRAVLNAVRNCPAVKTGSHWMVSPTVTEAQLGSTRLYIVLCHQAGDDEYFAAVTQSDGQVHRQSLPGFNGRALVPDVVDREAGRRQELGQLHWEAGRQRLVGELSAGCAARTEYIYRWSAGRFVLSQQRNKRGCASDRWRNDYVEPGGR